MESAMHPAPDTPTSQAHTTGAGVLTPEDIKSMREANARYFAEERARDARRLAAYQRECLASWHGGDAK
jgi:hypothetical protein